MNAMQSLDYRAVPWATAILQLAQKINPRAYVTSAKRSRADQQRLYLAAQAGRSRFPAAAPGTSKHETGRAFDLGGLTASQLRYLGRVWTSWGGRWGGSFRKRDPIHFETR